MKSGELKKVAQSYASFLPAPWQRVGNEFMRSEGDWVQIVSFNASRFAEQYVPRSCMEFLKMPGVPTGSFCAQELHAPNGTQRWIKTLHASPADVFEQMARQFKPTLFKPLNLSEVRHLLAEGLSYWPHAYALCVMACEEGNMVDAKNYFSVFASLTADRPYSWVEVRKHELADCLKLVASPETLKTHLESFRIEKLRALKLKIAHLNLYDTQSA